MNPERLSYRKKMYLLLVGFSGIVILFFQFSFSETLQLRRDLLIKEERLAELVRQKDQFDLVKQNVTSDSASTITSSEVVRTQLATFISIFSDSMGCAVMEIPEAKVYVQSGVEITTNLFVIEGNFLALVKLLRFIEHEHNQLCKVVSSKFFTSNHPSGKRPKRLLLQIITQSVKHL